MNAPHYPSLTWPWVGLILCLALLGQEYLFLAVGPNAPLTAYRIMLMAVGVASLALILLPPWRLGHVLGFVVCAGLLAYAYYLQYVDGLEPCPMCIVQRVAVAGMGLVFLIAAFHNPGRIGATVYAACVRDEPQLHDRDAAVHGNAEEGARRQRRVRGEGLGIPAPVDRRLDAGVLHRDDRGEHCAHSSRLTGAGATLSLHRS